MQTELKIYGSEKTANMIAGKLAKRNPNQKYHVVKVTTGFQVAPVTVGKPSAVFDKPAPVATPKEQAAKTPKVVDAAKQVMVMLPLQGQSPAYLNVVLDGKVTYVGKSTVISYQVDEEAGTVLMVMDRKLAKKRGFPMTPVTVGVDTAEAQPEAAQEGGE